MSNNITENITKLKSELPSDVKLVAVSKTKPVEDLQQAYAVGQRIFGENKVQELQDKYPVLPSDIQWHMIGHLQRNKVKYIAPFIALIHGVDSFKLLKEINKQALKNSRTIPLLLQFHIAQETTKFGLSIDEASEMLNSDEFKSLNNIRIDGVMGMASNTDDEERVLNEFLSLHSIFSQLKDNFFPKNSYFKEISMGMSGDYALAIKAGSTMIRVGSSIFGSR